MACGLLAPYTRSAVFEWFQDYLDTKRLVFPRFYFLSNEELLKIVSKAKQPAALQQSFQNCFGGVRAVALAANGTTIEGLCSENGDKVELLSSVSALVAVEQWFAGLEQSMIASLRHHLKLAVEAKANGESDPAKWLGLHPPQCVMTAAMIHWCSTTEEALELAHQQGDFKLLEECLSSSNTEIQQ